MVSLSSSPALVLHPKLAICYIANDMNEKLTAILAELCDTLEQLYGSAAS